jgi:hypothetical protein
LNAASTLSSTAIEMSRAFTTPSCGKFPNERLLFTPPTA